MKTALWIFLVGLFAPLWLCWMVLFYGSHFCVALIEEAADHYKLRKL